MKTTTKNAGGTSYHNHNIKTTVTRLKEVFGEPEFVENDGSDKVNFEWVLEDDNGRVVTIYDWKEYRKIDENELIEFHIGGNSGKITLNAKEEIEKLIK